MKHRGSGEAGVVTLVRKLAFDESWVYDVSHGLEQLAPSVPEIALVSGRERQGRPGLPCPECGDG